MLILKLNRKIGVLAYYTVKVQVYVMAGEEELEDLNTNKITPMKAQAEYYSDLEATYCHADYRQACGTSGQGDCQCHGFDQ